MIYWNIFTADTFKIENRAFYAVNYKPFLFFRKIFEVVGFVIEGAFYFKNFLRAFIRPPRGLSCSPPSPSIPGRKKEL
jgi:hypothetical protein